MTTPEEVVAGLMETCDYCSAATCCGAVAPGVFPRSCTREPGHPPDYHVACGDRHEERRWPVSSSG